MGWRNRVLDGLDDARKALNAAHDEAARGDADAVDIACHALTAQHAITELLAELVESTCSPGVPIRGNEERRARRGGGS